uniref:Variant surface glycoprotein 1125.1643 n=1 Tax=Trypanosoma brucei TaxID=5691 RepID=A0A1J0R7G6_9TRYP|nr:variant surface glycoprotein 1125.1643 [Trypanosoma brucei]
MLLITLTTTTAILVLKQVSGAGPANGQNKQTFTSLCALVLAAQLENPKVETPQTAQTALTTAKHISTLLKHGGDVVALAKQLKNNAALEKEHFPATCKTEHAEPCKQAATWLNNLSEAEKAKLLAATEDNRGFKQQINETVEALKDLGTPGGELKVTKPSGDVATKLREAVYGAPGPIPADPTVTVTTDRETSCGKADPAPGAMAAKSIVGTIVCLCATDSGDSTSNKGCYKTPTAAQDFTPGAKTVNQWNNILGACKELHPNHEKIGYKLVAPAVAALQRELYSAKGRNRDKTGILGAIDGTGAGSCTGEHGSNNSACAMFKSTADTIQEPTWMNKAREALEEIAKRQDAKSATTVAAGEAAALNATLTTLLNLNKLTALKQQPTKPPPTGNANAVEATKQHEEADKDCKSKEKDTECTEPCTWEGGDAKTRKHCKLNTTAVNNQAAKAEKNGATGGAASTGCAKDGNKAECDADKTGDKQNCVWRKGKDDKDKGKEMCRSSSFLIKKKLSPSMAAVFVGMAAF